MSSSRNKVVDQTAKTEIHRRGANRSCEEELIEVQKQTAKAISQNESQEIRITALESTALRHDSSILQVLEKVGNITTVQERIFVTMEHVKDNTDKTLHQSEAHAERFSAGNERFSKIEGDTKNLLEAKAQREKFMRDVIIKIIQWMVPIIGLIIALAVVKVSGITL